MAAQARTRAEFEEMMAFMWTMVDDLKTFLVSKTSCGVNGGELVPRPGPDKRHVSAYERGHRRVRQQHEETTTETVDIHAVVDTPLTNRHKKKQKTVVPVPESAAGVPVLPSPATAHARSIATILARAVKDGKFDAAHLNVTDLKQICRLNGISVSGNKVELVGKVNTYLVDVTTSWTSGSRLELV